MATEAGRAVPVLLHPHTEALAAFLIPGAHETRNEGLNGNLQQDQQNDGVGPSRHQQEQQQQRQEQGLSQPPKHGDVLWVSPPALPSLREQAKQLQNQKRAKQRQHITMDATPSRYELPPELQQLRAELQQQSPNADGMRNFTLVGVSPQQQGTPTVSHRRERDGGVVVPLRMMSSLLITQAPPRGPREGPTPPGAVDYAGGGDAGVVGAAAPAAVGVAAAVTVAAMTAVATANGGVPGRTRLRVASAHEAHEVLEPSEASQPLLRRQTCPPPEGARALLTAAAGPAAGIADKLPAPAPSDDGGARDLNLDLDLADLPRGGNEAMPPPRRHARAAAPLPGLGLGHACRGLGLPVVSTPGPALQALNPPGGGAMTHLPTAAAANTTGGRALSTLSLSAEQSYLQPMAVVRGEHREALGGLGCTDPSDLHPRQRQMIRDVRQQLGQQQQLQEQLGQQQRLQEQLGQQQRQAQAPHLAAESPAASAGLDHPRRAAAPEGVDDEGDDGAMLIEVGSADRTAEGALLPTPERPRAPTGPATGGWDALRGMSFRGGDAGDGAGGGGGQLDGVMGTLALLSSHPAADSGAAGGDRLQWQPSPLQPEEELPDEMAIGEPLQSAPELGPRSVGGDSGGGGGAAEGRIHYRLLERPSGLGQAGMEAAAGGAGGSGEDGFDADDEGEGEAGAREERARGAFRLSGRTPRWRPLPGLVASPPWSPTSPPAPEPALPSAHQRLGLLAGFSSLTLALPRGTETPNVPGQQQQQQPPGCPASALAQLHLRPGPLDPDQGERPPGSVVEAGPGVCAAHAAALEELLKLKCSLRRAVQGGNAQAMGLILALLAGLPVTPQLLADSQVAALVCPLQSSSSSAEVAAAARRLTAGWKEVLKAAARRAPAPPASTRGHSRTAAAAAATAAAFASMDLDGGSSRGGGFADNRGAGASHNPHLQHHQHQRQPREWPHQALQLQASLVESVGPRAAGAGDAVPSHHHTLHHSYQPRDVDVRDQAEHLQARPHLHSQPHRRASGLTQRPSAAAAVAHDRSLSALGLSLARSQSDVLPEALAAAAEAEAMRACGGGGAVAADDAAAGHGPGALQPGVRRSRAGLQVPLQLAPLQLQMQAARGAGDGRGGVSEGEEGAAAAAFLAQGPRIEPGSGPRGRAGDDAPSGSRTVSEAEGGSSGEMTNDEGGSGLGLRARRGAAAASAAGEADSIRDLRFGGGGGGGGCKCCSGGSGAVSAPARSYSPLPTPTAAAATAGGVCECAGTADRFLHSKVCPRAPSGGGLGDVGAIAAIPRPAHASGASAANSPPPGSAALPLPAWNANVSAGMGLSPASPGAVTAQPPLLAPPCALSPPAALPMAAAVGGGGGMLLSPPMLTQPLGGRKRKGERSSSRRRSGNPSKRPAPGAILAGPRVLQPGSLPLPLTLPMLLPDAAGAGAASDDQRPHGGPIAGVKTPARSSLLGLHAPLSKRQRHHVTGSGGTGGSSAHGGGGGGGGSATQVRRVSLLLSSLELGSAAGERGGEQGEQAATTGAATEGDADADADMGSQDDEAAMMTSDDDLMPAGPRGGDCTGGFAGWDDAGAELVVVSGPGRGGSDRDRDRGRGADAPPPGLEPGGDGGGGGGGGSSGGAHGLRSAAGGGAGPGAMPVTDRLTGGDGSGGVDGGVTGWSVAVEPGPIDPPASDDTAG